MSKIINCKTCGKEIASNAKACPSCGAKNKKPIYTKWWFWIIIISVIVYAGGSSNNTTNVNSNNSLVTSSGELNNTINKEEPQNEISEDEYKNKCDSYNYEDIARNPQNYKDKYMKFTGEVIQTSEAWGTVTLRINVTKNEYGFWEDTVYATYKYSENESKILENDIITVYGICKGDKTYTSVLGSSVTIPNIEVAYWDLIN